MERAKPMKRVRLFKKGRITLLCVGLILSGPVLQATAADTGSKQETRGDQGRAPAVTDVALQNGGTLLGHVVDPQGKAVAETPVSIQQADRELVRTVTDRSGGFRVANLRGGTYRIVAGEAAGIYRLWAPGTAPPSARPTAMIASGDQQLVLGQGGRLMQFLRNPWVIAGLVTLAIALPVAIHNMDDGSRS
jgi:hypothetical protein